MHATKGGGLDLSARSGARLLGLRLFCLYHRHGNVGVRHGDLLEANSPDSLAHGIISFFFNVTLIALTVGLVGDAVQR